MDRRAGGRDEEATVRAAGYRWRGCAVAFVMKRSEGSLDEWESFSQTTSEVGGAKKDVA